MMHHDRSWRWFLMPWATGLIFLTLLPLIASLGLSLTRIETDASGKRLTWVGADHYREALGVDTTHTRAPTDPWIWRLMGGRPSDPLCYRALGNSLFYTLPAVPTGLALSLAAAMLLHQPYRGMGAFRALFYLPHVLGGAATVLVWSWLLNPQFGWVNRMIGGAYRLVDPLIQLVTGYGTSDWPLPGWLYSPTWCKPAVILMHAWTMGGAMLIFLAALRRVPDGLYEAARLDGAGVWPRFRHVTLPQITPALLFNLVLGVIFAMQSFTEVYLLQNRSQDDGLLFYGLYLYQVAFESPHRLGYAAALGWILTALLSAVVIPLVGLSRRWMHYASEG